MGQLCILRPPKSAANPSLEQLKTAAEGLAKELRTTLPPDRHPSATVLADLLEQMPGLYATPDQINEIRLLGRRVPHCVDEKNRVYQFCTGLANLLNA